jgi:hyaluronan synthase
MIEFINSVRKIGKSLSVAHYFVQINTFLLIAAAMFVLSKFQYQFEEIRAIMLSSALGSIFYHFTLTIFAFKILFLVFILIHFILYKPVDSVSDNSLPTCTIIVPAYNEGRFVYDTLISISNSDYPKEKIQLIAIDDGSKDDTWQWMVNAKEQLGDFLMILKQPENKGKRYALYRGINLAEGDVIVTIDSDSLVDQNSLRNLVSPFVVDENCGAVAGNVKILNSKNAIIPKMLNVSFAYNFGFIRAAQSNMKSVLCTPGALSAYRKEAVLNCLEEWANQTFLGVKTDIGEDRAMTNMILKQGYNTLYQNNAIVLTNIPETYSRLRRMYTRWERSNVRENIMMAKFVFSKFRKSSRMSTRVIFVSQWLRLIATYPAFIFMLLFIAGYPKLFISSTIVSVFLYSLIPAFYYGLFYNYKKSIWIFTYNIFYSFSLFWITPFAIVTAGKRGWLTRELKQQN